MKIISSCISIMLSLFMFVSVSCYAATSPQPVDVNDSTIVAQIHQSISENSTTSNLPVTVTSKNAIVHLSGKVNTDTEAEELIRIASENKNVKDVNTSKLVVTASNHKMSDTYITAKIKGLYIREKIFGENNISVLGVNVETTNGVVFLTGKVDTQEEADNAVKLAGEIKGVRGVDSKLIVR